jgi:Ankyrin repeats (3 copies)
VRVTPFLVALIFNAQTGLADEKSNPNGLDLKSAWFMPSLKTSADGMCESILSDVQLHFKTSKHWEGNSDGSGEYFTGLKKIPGPFRNGMGSDPTVRPVADDPRTFVIDSSRATRVYAHFQNQIGCGGACDMEKVLVSERRLTQSESENPALFGSTPNARAWTIYKSRKSGNHYIIGIVEDQMHVYKISTPKNWRLSCEITLMPKNLRGSNDLDLQAAASAIDTLNAAVLGMSRGSGDCGSAATAVRWRDRVQHALNQTLYRPWALRDDRDHSSENSYGDYDRIHEQLNTWSLEGLSEYQAFAAFETQLQQTRAELGRFYTKKFGWSSGISDSLAHDALKYAVSSGFGFYMYEPFPRSGEAELRRAILEHRPVKEISEISADEPTSTAVLDAAIRYPDALRFLLDRGANPNAGNGFGKTPLMYAVQYNQFEAVKILISHGADPNSATTWPTDTCYYNLSTAGMTALHYAVRYASTAIIKLLIANGAQTFIKTQKKYADGEYPLDWLRRYTGPKAIEANLNIADADLPKLVEILSIPSTAEGAIIATELTKRAAVEYRAGKFENSYRMLESVLSLDPHNEKALTDMPIVALRSNRIGRSLESADVVLKKFKSSEIQAGAWFNKGLACERADNEGLSYNGKYYCMGDLIFPFLNAWKLSPTESRKNKLRTLFKAAGRRTCSVSQKDGSVQYYRFELAGGEQGDDRERGQWVYVLHATSQAIDGNQLIWAGATTTYPYVVVRHNLGDFSITELRADTMALGRVSIGSHFCVPYR